MRTKLGWLAFWLLAAPAAADWLVTLEGRLIETDGPWAVEAETVVYRDLDGECRQMPLAEVDLEGSEETTALRAGRPYEPSALRVEADPRVTVYSHWRCGPCAEARELLDRLGVAYRERMEEDLKARRELRKKAGRKYILPVLDIGGEVVVGYRPEEIRRLVAELGKAPARESEEEVEEETLRVPGCRRAAADATKG